MVFLLSDIERIPACLFSECRTELRLTAVAQAMAALLLSEKVMLARLGLLVSLLTAGQIKAGGEGGNGLWTLVIPMQCPSWLW